MSEPEDRDIRRLLERAGPRQGLPPEARARLRAAAEEAWQAKVESHRRQSWGRGRRLRWGAVAAGLAAAAALLLVLNPDLIRLGPGPGDPPGLPPASPQVATLLSAQGSLSFEAVPRGGPQLPAGAILTTGADGLAALRLGSEPGDASELRLDRDSRLRLLAADEVELQRGALYFDSGRPADPAVDAAAEPVLQVVTPYGTAQDIGTQFEVRVTDTALRLRVREGIVELQRAGQQHRAGAGTQLLLDVSQGPEGTVEQSSIPTHGEGWGWVLEAANPFEIEGRTLADFLTWMERETGWQVRYETPAAHQAAERAVLHGSVTGLTPEEAVELTVLGSALDYSLEDGVLVLR